ncbi:MAG: hypothetical protein CVV31_04045 [Methanomicrobiales archaeon HGW-Methanomicrobiales-2]|nr:MAG: hypothetical protein CVV31_04045 [Methanomicrobiales archaeon HGW-Methanomicrobiales-2]
MNHFIARKDVNCTTTYTTGSRRGPDDPVCRRQAGRNSPCKEPVFEETDQVWTEAGFLPPEDYRRFVALLHRLAMEEEATASLLSSVLTATAAKSGTGRGYRILDPVKLRRTAGEYGIGSAAGGETGIAHAVTLAIIGEYEANMPEEHA